MVGSSKRSKSKSSSLDSLFKMQRKLNTKLRLDTTLDRSLDTRISYLCTAIIHEAVELQRLTNWKWWKQPRPINRNAAKEELIDIMHFVIHTCMELGMSPQDVVDEYRKKHRINIKRQEEGY